MSRALRRLERVLTMVPWLLDHPGVAVDEVTERFGISRNELLDDLDILGYCGLPGYGGGDLIEVSVFGDRVTVRMADFFARPLRLSLREALTLLLAADAVGSVDALGEAPLLRRAAATLREALGAEPARVAVDLAAPGEEWVPVLRDAVDRGAVVHLEYRSASRAQLTERDVEPWALVGRRGAWYLQGWCRLVDGPRDFRLDRIRRAVPTGQLLTSGTRGWPSPPVYRPGPDDTPVELDLAPPAWWVIEDAVVDTVTEHDGLRRVRLRTSSLEWVARLVVQLGGLASVVAPPALAERVREIAEQTLAGYRD